MSATRGANVANVAKTPPPPDRGDLSGATVGQILGLADDQLRSNDNAISEGLEDLEHAEKNSGHFIALAQQVLKKNIELKTQIETLKRMHGDFTGDLKNKIVELLSKIDANTANLNELLNRIADMQRKSIESATKVLVKITDKEAFMKQIDDTILNDPAQLENIAGLVGLVEKLPWPDAVPDPLSPGSSRSPTPTPRAATPPPRNRR